MSMFLRVLVLLVAVLFANVVLAQSVQRAPVREAPPGAHPCAELRCPPGTRCAVSDSTGAAACVAGESPETALRCPPDACPPGFDCIPQPDPRLGWCCQRQLSGRPSPSQDDFDPSRWAVELVPLGRRGAAPVRVLVDASGEFGARGLAPGRYRVDTVPAAIGVNEPGVNRVAVAGAGTGRGPAVPRVIIVMSDGINVTGDPRAGVMVGAEGVLRGRLEPPVGVMPADGSERRGTRPRD